MLLGVDGVAHLVELDDVFADVLGVEQHGLLADVTGVVHQLDDLLPRFSIGDSVLGQGQFVFVSQMFPQS